MASVVAVFVLSAAMCCFFEEARRLIPIVYSRRQVGRRVYGGQQAHLPLKVNTAGVIPPIFASSLLMFPATLAQMDVPGMNDLQNIVNRGDWIFNTFFAILIIYFCFFYTSVTFHPVEVAENLKKQQANIPGIRPGKQTSEFIDHVMKRITACGSTYVAAICVIPAIIGSSLGVAITFGGTTIMIVVSVGLDTVRQVEGHLIKRNYEGLAGRGTGKVRGRRAPQNA
jgi:preprotein translocase subunit SecY